MLRLMLAAMSHSLRRPSGRPRPRPTFPERTNVIFLLIVEAFAWKTQMVLASRCYRWSNIEAIIFIAAADMHMR